MAHPDDQANGERVRQGPQGRLGENANTELVRCHLAHDLEAAHLHPQLDQATESAHLVVQQAIDGGAGVEGDEILIQELSEFQASARCERGRDARRRPGDPSHRDG